MRLRNFRNGPDSYGAGDGPPRQESRPERASREHLAAAVGRDPGKRQNLVPPIGRSAQDLREGVPPDPSFRLRVHGEDVDAAGVERGEDPGNPVPAPDLLEARQVGGDLDEAGSLEDERSGGPRAAQVFERELAQHAHRLFREQPRRRPESARAVSKDLLVRRESPKEPLPDPRDPFSREGILPGAVVPGVELHLVPTALDLPAKSGKGGGDHRGGEERPVQRGTEAVEAGGVRTEHLEEEARIPQELVHGLSRVVRAERKEERRGYVERVEGREERRHPLLHPAPRVDVDLEAEDTALTHNTGVASPRPL